MKILLITDIQEGFINDSTRHIPEEMIRHIKSASYDLVIATRFINKVGSLYQSELNTKDMTMLSAGSKLVPGMGQMVDIVLMRSTYTSLTEDVIKLLQKNNMQEVYLAGMNTETSILATAFDLFDKGIKPVVLTQLCGSVRGEKTNQEALEILKHIIREKNLL